ncbi:hypothetical protein DEU56DRAFT_753236 [Suillus clintonianus]|uniref:uncharacterized protein n=1 Tax=Suillus clintonianus TaxID=1904413 RepID=UPI001B87CDBC|nr:uncharacterized protein DEU56DRAFT_753236 [Suillus clintonianus]KAG2147974.1 hypothetical protein DEU56DRAFT_753236 [Suillus clintonianus]
MNFTPTAYKSSAPQNLHNLLSSSLLNQEHSGTSPSLSTPETSTPSPLLDTFGLSQDAFLDTSQNNLNQPQPLVGSSSWNRHGMQPLSMQNRNGYMRSSDQIQSLLEDNEHLRQENLVLSGREPLTPQAPPIDQSKLRFFTLTQFNAWLKCADANMKERGQLPFLEDMNGQPLSREKKAAICQSMRELWRGFKIKKPSTFEVEESTHLKDQKAIVKSKTIKSEPSSVNSENDKNKPALPAEKPAKKHSLTVSSNEDSSDELVESPLLSKKAKLHHANLDPPISLTPPTEITTSDQSPHVMLPTEITTSDQSPHDVNVISISMPPVIIPVIKNPLKSSVRPLPRMISSTMTTTVTPHINTPSSPPSPGPSNNTPPPAVPAAPSPITPASTTNAKCMRPGLNKNRRTLCTHRWLNAVTKDSTTTDFKIYWTALSKDTKKQSYELILISNTSSKLLNWLPQASGTRTRPMLSSMYQAEQSTSRMNRIVST